MAESVPTGAASDRSDACPVCASMGVKFSRNREGFRIFHCMECRSDFAALITEQLPSYDEHYDDASNYHGYHNMLEAEKAGRPALYWYQPRMLEVAGDGKGRVHVDLGSGLGTFLAASRRAGWTPLGVDISRSAAAMAKRELGIETHLGDFLQLIKPDKPIGWISAFEVLEHVYDPRAIVRHMYDLLEPGGLVTVSVPNGRSRQEKYNHNPILIPPTHINFYSRTGLRRMFESAGFETTYDYEKPIAWGEINISKPKKVLLLPLLVLDRILLGHTGNRLLWVGRKRA